MNSVSVRSLGERDGTHVCIPIPVGDRDAFTHDATADILQVLTDNPEKTFSNRELHRLTGKGMGNVNGAVVSLEQLGVVFVDCGWRANHVQINPEKLVRSDDRISPIPQPEYYAPVRAVRDRLVDRIDDDAGVVLFGSVACGDADRASDIDEFVIIQDERMKAQREAHSIEDDIASEQFEDDRYEARIVVETRDSAVTHDRIRDVLSEGITIHDTPVLEDVKREVFADGA